MPGPTGPNYALAAESARGVYAFIDDAYDQDGDGVAEEKCFLHYYVPDFSVSHSVSAKIDPALSVYDPAGKSVVLKGKGTYFVKPCTVEVRIHGVNNSGTIGATVTGDDGAVLWQFDGWPAQVCHLPWDW